MRPPPAPTRSPAAAAHQAHRHARSTILQRRTLEEERGTSVDSRSMRGRGREACGTGSTSVQRGRCRRTRMPVQASTATCLRTRIQSTRSAGSKEESVGDRSSMVSCTSPLQRTPPRPPPLPPSSPALPPPPYRLLRSQPAQSRAFARGRGRHDLRRSRRFRAT